MSCQSRRAINQRISKPRLGSQRGVFRYGARAEPSVIRYNRKFDNV